MFTVCIYLQYKNTIFLSIYASRTTKKFHYMLKYFSIAYTRSFVNRKLFEKSSVAQGCIVFTQVSKKEKGEFLDYRETLRISRIDIGPDTTVSAKYTMFLLFFFI